MNSRIIKIPTVLLLATLLAAALFGCSNAADKTGAGTAKSVAARTNLENEKKPTEAGAKRFAREYWALVDGRMYMSLFEQLSRKDRERTDGERFFERLFLENQYNMNSEVVEVVQREREATVTVEKMIKFGREREVAREEQFWFFRGGRWYPRLDQAQLLLYGALPEDIGITEVGEGKMGRLPGALVTIESADSLGQREDRYISIDFNLTNSSTESRRIDLTYFLILVGPRLEAPAPSTESGTGLIVELAPGETASAQVDYPVTEPPSGRWSVLAGTDPDRVLLPFNL